MALPASSRLRLRVAALLPVLCLIHCIVTALLAAALPAAALWLHSEWLEGTLTLLSALATGMPLLRRWGEHDRQGLSLALFLAAVTLSGVGWIYDQEPPRLLGLLLFIATQLAWWRSRRRQAACACATPAPALSSE
jgi:hypothetical protein